MAKDSNIKTFPLRLELTLNDEIDAYVFHTKAETKHQYILDAVKEKMERDRVLLGKTAER